MVWAAPVVQTLARPAFALGHGTPKESDAFSFVAMTVQCSDGVHQLKYNFDGADAGWESEPGALPSCSAPPGWQFPPFTGGAPNSLLPSGLSGPSSENGETVLTLTGDCTFLGGVLKKGSACVTMSVSQDGKKLSTGNPDVGVTATEEPTEEPTEVETLDLLEETTTAG